MRPSRRGRRQPSQRTGRPPPPCPCHTQHFHPRVRPHGSACLPTAMPGRHRRSRRHRKSVSIEAAHRGGRRVAHRARRRGGAFGLVGGRRCRMQPHRRRHCRCYRRGGRRRCYRGRCRRRRCRHCCCRRQLRCRRHRPHRAFGMSPARARPLSGAGAPAFPPLTGAPTAKWPRWRRLWQCGSSRASTGGRELPLSPAGRRACAHGGAHAPRHSRQGGPRGYVLPCVCRALGTGDSQGPHGQRGA